VDPATGEELLKIMASSMLTVATFSLATLVAAAAAVTTNTSPRAAALVLEDRSAQAALSSFIGAFIFSVVGLIALGSGVFSESSRFVLFALSLVVLAYVVVLLLRWIDQLAGLSRVGFVIDRVERATRKALQARRPFLGGMPDGEIPPGALPVDAPAVGYVQHVDVARLDAEARRRSVIVHLALLPGAFVQLSRPLLFVEGADRLDAEAVRAFQKTVVIGDSRTFHQDPRFGLVVLAEIASRAMSPALNDPGTAIDVVGTAVRLLSTWAAEHWEAEPERRFTHVAVPPLSAADVFDDVFRPVARDGAAHLEVGAALQKGLADLAGAKASGFAQEARAHSRAALERAETALSFEPDRAKLRALAAEVGAPGPDAVRTC
jgi:uncharacterized membrane protein